ncbi:unnamed protein product, partial [Heterotrigona itama]
LGSIYSRKIASSHMSDINKRSSHLQPCPTSWRKKAGFSKNTVGKFVSLMGMT